MGNNVSIFCAGQAGDCATISSVLMYKNELWGEDCHIIWYIAKGNMDLLKYQDIELREFPRGFGYPELVKENGGNWEDWSVLVDENNHLNIELAKSYPSLKGIDFGYFPAPHQLSVEKRLAYPLCSKKVFDVPMHWAWHPVLDWSEEEMIELNECVDFPYHRKVAIESFCGSGQSKITDEQIRRTMEICEEILGKCVFIFVSHKYLNGNEQFPEDIRNEENNFNAGHFTVRQCGYLVSLCDLLISTSSGITVASSAWQLNPTPILQFCGSDICSTRAMALGRFELVTHDDKPLEVAQNEYYLRLKLLLNEIK